MLREMQKRFNPSEMFAPWIESENQSRGRENPNQRGRRKKKQVQVKIGHGGTLDPLATGVLIAGIGKGTKSLQDFLLCTKVYDTVILFGTSTDTYDVTGKVLKKAPYEHITKEMVENALGQFRGKFMQLPPLFSALKMNGKPLYEYAREGKEIPREIERRPVEVLELEMIEWMGGGAHEHKAPTDEAGAAEIKVATQVWAQESVLPASDKSELSKTEGLSTVGVEKAGLKKGGSTIATAKEEIQDASVEKDKQDPQMSAVPVQDSTMQELNTESGKRKLSEGQDDLVHERPVSKQQKQESSSDETVMSGGLAAPPTPANTSVNPESSDVAKTTPSKGPPAARLRMTVTSGFYVRSLCHDLGAAVGSAALMAKLERTKQGDFELGKNVLEYEDLEAGEKVWGPKVEAMLDDWYEKGRPAPKE